MNKDFIKGVSIGCALAVVAGSTLVFAEPVRHNIEAVYNDIKIIVHGKTATPSNGEPFIYDGTTYLPVRAVAEALGEVVDWDGNTNIVYIGTERPVATPTPTPTTSSSVRSGAVKSDGSGRELVIVNRDGQEVFIAFRGREGALVRDDRGVVVGIDWLTEAVKSDRRAIPGDADYYDGSGETWEYYQSRPNMTLYETDPTRPRAKAGDTFITAEGQSYMLEAGAGGVIGQGLPIATDLGRIDSFGTAMTNGYRPDSTEFGWLTSDVNTCGHEYIVYKTGEGHYDWEWEDVADYTKPKEAGSEGQWSVDGYWVYHANRWVFAVNNNTLWNL